MVTCESAVWGRCTPALKLYPIDLFFSFLFFLFFLRLQTVVTADGLTQQTVDRVCTAVHSASVIPPFSLLNYAFEHHECSHPIPFIINVGGLNVH